MPVDMARAATSISGTNTSPALNWSPMMPIGLIRPSSRMVLGSMPSSSAWGTSFFTSLRLPLSTALEMSSVNDIGSSYHESLPASAGWDGSSVPVLEQAVQPVRTCLFACGGMRLRR